MSGDDDNSNDERKDEESLGKAMVADVSTEDPRENKGEDSEDSTGESAEEESDNSEDST